MATTTLIGLGFFHADTWSRNFSGTPKMDLFHLFSISTYPSDLQKNVEKTLNAKEGQYELC